MLTVSQYLPCSACVPVHKGIWCPVLSTYKPCISKQTRGIMKGHFCLSLREKNGSFLVFNTKITVKQNASHVRSSPSLPIQLLTCIKPVTFPRAVPSCTPCSLISRSFRNWHHHKAFDGCFGVIGPKLHKTTVNYKCNSMNRDGSLGNVGGYYHLWIRTQWGHCELPRLSHIIKPQHQCTRTPTKATWKISGMTVPVNTL